MPSDTFAARLAALMAEAGLDIVALGKAAGLPRQTLHKLLRGERQPSLATAAKIAHALGKNLTVFDTLAPLR